MLVHDFPTDAEGKAIPYGVYDMACNEAWVSVGRDHDTPAFAVASIRHWWRQMGCDAYPDATALFITADAGGSNGYRLRAWKHELQQLADETRLTIHVSHFPPGTSKWNKIEHRLFCHITANWRGTPLTTYETIVDRIGNTRTETGLLVRAELNASEYPTGVTVTKEEMDAIALVRDEFHAGRLPPDGRRPRRRASTRPFGGREPRRDPRHLATSDAQTGRGRESIRIARERGQTRRPCREPSRRATGTDARRS